MLLSTSRPVCRVYPLELYVFQLKSEPTQWNYHWQDGHGNIRACGCVTADDEAGAALAARAEYEPPWSRCDRCERTFNWCGWGWQRKCYCSQQCRAGDGFQVALRKQQDAARRDGR